MKKPVYWLAGNTYDCDLMLNQLLKKHGRDNVAILDGSSDSVDKVFANLIKSDLFSCGTKVIRLRGLPPDYVLIVDYLKYVNKNRVLIIESPLQTKVSGRRIEASKSKLFKEIKKVGKVLEFPVVVKDVQARNWTIKAAEKAYKKDIEDVAAARLVECKNCNLDHIFAELSKLCSYIGKRRKILLDDVQICVKDDREFNTWQMVDDLTEGKLKESLQSYSRKKKQYFATL